MYLIINNNLELLFILVYKKSSKRFIKNIKTKQIQQEIRVKNLIINCIVNKYESNEKSYIIRSNKTENRFINKIKNLVSCKTKCLYWKNRNVVKKGYIKSNTEHKSKFKLKLID